MILFFGLGISRGGNSSSSSTSSSSSNSSSSVAINSNNVINNFTPEGHAAFLAQSDDISTNPPIHRTSEAQANIARTFFNQILQLRDIQLPHQGSGIEVAQGSASNTGAGQTPEITWLGRSADNIIGSMLSTGLNGFFAMRAQEDMHNRMAALRQQFAHLTTNRTGGSAPTDSPAGSSSSLFSNLPMVPRFSLNNSYSPHRSGYAGSMV